MSPKGTFWSDTFEQLAELGQSTVKKTGQSIAQTFSPLKILEKPISLDYQDSSKPQKENLQEKQGEKPNHTSLDFEKLQQKYQNQDKEKTEVLRQRLFQLVKKSEEETWQKTKQEQLEKERIEAYQSQEKKKKEEERKKQEQFIELPKGKVRRSIFSAKKVAQRAQAEVKPASGKQ